MIFHPDVLAAHMQFGGDLESMQKLYEYPELKAEVERLRAAKDPAPTEKLRVTGFRGDPLRVVLSSGHEATVTQKLIDAFASPSPFDQMAKPNQGHGDRRQTFVIPEGYEAVRDADGRATGEVRPIPAPAPNGGAL